MLMGPCAMSARNCAIFSASAACAAVNLWCISSCFAAVFRFLHSPCLASLQTVDYSARSTSWMRSYLAFSPH